MLGVSLEVIQPIDSEVRVFVWLPGTDVYDRFFDII